MNKIRLCGFLGKDPDIRYTGKGLAIANFSLAVNTTRNGEKKTIWFYIRVFGKLAEDVGNNLSKGSRIDLNGRFEIDNWVSDDGEKIKFMYVIANYIKFPNYKKVA